MKNDNKISEDAINNDESADELSVEDVYKNWRNATFSWLLPNPTEEEMNNAALVLGKTDFDLFCTVRFCHQKRRWAEGELLKRHKGLVHMWMRHYYDVLPQDELESAGSEGLLKAIMCFDIARGFRFSTYARWWIQQSMFREVQNMRRTVRIPVHMCELMHIFRSTQALLSGNLGRQATNEDVRGALGLDQNKFDLILEAGRQRTLSFSKPSDDNDDGTGLDISDALIFSSQEVTSVAPGLWNSFVPNPETCMIRREDEVRMRALVDTLFTLAGVPDRDRLVCSWHYGVDTPDEEKRTLEEIGAFFSICRERVRQIEEEMLGRVRTAASKSGFQKIDVAVNDPRFVADDIAGKPPLTIHEAVRMAVAALYGFKPNDIVFVKKNRHGIAKSIAKTKRQYALWLATYLTWQITELTDADIMRLFEYPTVDAVRKEVVDAKNARKSDEKFARAVSSACIILMAITKR